ncbi:MAG: hypothetical protein PHP85_03860 [Gallionella sp.]|nr:hypothetical protein [Gallionella sp.]
MCDLTFNKAEFPSAINELVPMHHRKIVEAALNSDSLSESDIENIGLSLTGEQRKTGFIVSTSTLLKAESSMWQAIKNEIYDFLCTKSKTYTKERTDGTLTIKNLITIIATAIGGTFHVAIGVITGAVTLALLCALKIGKNAWCSINAPQV